LAGCIGPTPPPAPTPSEPRPLAEIISAIDANAARATLALWSNAVTVTASLRDEQGRTQVHNLEGSLLFRPPRDLRVDLRHGLGERVMGIGSNADEFWAWIEPQRASLWWGRHRHAGRPCAEGAPVRPDQLAGILGVTALPRAGGDLVGPAQKALATHDALYYLRRRDDGSWTLDREYLVERDPPFLVRVIVFFDERGRRSMSAYLDDYRPAWPDGPLVPHRLNVRWPADDASFTLEAAAMEGKNQVHPAAFTRPQSDRLPPTIRRIIQVDARCDRSADEGEAPR
jgi:hypothetical protein